MLHSIRFIDEWELEKGGLMKIKLRHQRPTKAFAELPWGAYFMPSWAYDSGKMYQKFGGMDYQCVFVACLNTGEIFPHWKGTDPVYEWKPVEITDDGTMIFELV